MKKSAKYEGKIGNNEKAEGIGDWITISTPDDLFKDNIDVDFRKLNYYHCFLMTMPIVRSNLPRAWEN